MVILRYKKLKSGKYSLYLDISTTDEAGNSIRQSKFLKLYTDEDWFGKIKYSNNDRSTVLQAEKIRKQTELELSAKLKGVKARTEKSNKDGSFSEYLRKRERKRSSGLIKRFDKFNGNRDIRFSEITPALMSEFLREIRESGLKQHTICNYINRLKAAWNAAVSEELAKGKPFAYIKVPRAPESERMTLTESEVQKLIDTPFPQNPNLRLAFLFACFTGLRISDIYLLDWSEIVNKDKVLHLRLVPQKTRKTAGTVLEAPLCEAAVDVLEEVAKTSEKCGKVFTNLTSVGNANALLKWWAALAKINKKLHFHVARHTFSTLAFTAGIDIYTVSKLLAHTNVSTTGIYAKLVDEKKRSEVAKLPML